MAHRHTGLSALSAAGVDGFFALPPERRAGTGLSGCLWSSGGKGGHCNLPVLGAFSPVRRGAALCRADALCRISKRRPLGISAGAAGGGAVDGTAQIGRLCPCGGDLLPGPSADPGAGTAFFHPRYEPRACAAGLDNGRSGRNSGHAGAGWRTELRGVRRIFRGERHQAFW